MTDQPKPLPLREAIEVLVNNAKDDVRLGFDNEVLCSALDAFNGWGEAIDETWLGTISAYHEAMDEWLIECRESMIGVSALSVSDEWEITVFDKSEEDTNDAEWMIIGVMYTRGDLLLLLAGLGWKGEK